MLNRTFHLLLLSVCAGLLLFGCAEKTVKPTTMKTYAFRLKPGEDLKQGIAKVVTENDIKAGWISTAVGSLERYNIRFANQPNGSTATGHFEIVSLTGTLSVNGSHIHISVSDSTGKTIGGHLLDGNRVFTTAEIIIQQTDEFAFTREKDGTTEWEELEVKPR